MKAIYMLIYQFVKGHAMATKYFCCNAGKLILRAFFARSPDGSMVSFRYYLLEGDTIS